jgi:hypothetical protein
MEDKNEKRPTSMVAPKSKAQEKLQPIDELAGERGMPAPQLAGMCRANGWAEGKQVTATEFETAMTAYIRRPMGSGRG